MSRDPAIGRESELPVGVRFHEEIAEGWTRGYSVGSFLRRRACLLPILDRHVEPGHLWLDLGCGSGVLTKELVARGAVVTAIDGSPAMLREAQALIGQDPHFAATWLWSDVQCLAEVSNESCDGILCSSVVEYVESPCGLLGEAIRVLRPGGKLIISVPPRWSALRTVQKVVRGVGLLVGQDKFSYLGVSKFEIDPKDVRQWLSDAGFILDRVTKFDPLLPRGLFFFFRPSLLILEAHKM